MTDDKPERGNRSLATKCIILQRVINESPASASSAFLAMDHAPDYLFDRFQLDSIRGR